ncbi:MAG: hypothetical protein E7616_02685 [Ruminococcaceae bacterium]|nr:hypothetical protein [Oscillospiraceae bacterium]
MTTKKFSNALGNIGENYIDEAVNYTAKRKSNACMKWGAVAACFALVAVLGIGVFQSGLFGGQQIATLDNGNTITFIKTDSTVGQLDIAFQIETRDLTENEIKILFNDLPVNAYALFNAEDNSILGLEGMVDGMKLIVSVPGVSLVDAVIDGKENASEVNGVTVNAGYFVSEKTSIYYATLKLGESTIYIEHAGAKDKRENIKNEISAMIQKLIVIGEIDLSQLSK